MNDRARILIVDDDAGTRKMLTLFLRKEGYEAEAAATGQEALDRARKHVFDLALIDVDLPVAEGARAPSPMASAGAALPGGSKTLLLVEDETAFQERECQEPQF